MAVSRDLGKAMNISREKDRHMKDTIQSEKGTCSSSHNHAQLYNIFMFSFNLEFERKHTTRGIICADWKMVGCISITYLIAVSYYRL